MYLAKKDLEKALQTLSQKAVVFAPVVENIKDPVSQAEISEKKFMPYYDGAKVVLEGWNTIKPVKDVLFPPVEKMYQYKTGKDAYIKELFPEDTPRIIFGIRPCDMRSIDSMDKVFLTRDYIDSYYARRREHVTIVAFGCTEPSETCFCDSMGLNPNQAPTADVMMNVAADSTFTVCSDCGAKILSEEGKYVLTAQTEKGQKLLEQLKACRTKEEAGDGELLGKNSGTTEEIYIGTECSLKIVKAENLDEKLSKMFEHPIWDKVTKGCIGCGTCTFVCPTCYCFDIDNENHGAEGCKYRCWDSCMFSDYSRMAGGANPRPTKKERLRNRYLHKLEFFNERYGETLCVGCGRCIESCPAHIDISDFIEKASLVDVDAKSYSDADFASDKNRTGEANVAADNNKTGKADAAREGRA